MVLQPSEDLFEDTRMSFGEHLEELRSVLVRAILGLVVGFAIAMIFASQIITYLQRPLEEAIRDFMRTQAEKEIMARNDGFVPPELRPRLDNDRLIPRTLKVEPKELIDVMQEYFPDLEPALAQSEFDFAPSQLELEKVAGFARLLVEPPEDDEVAQLLGGLLSDEQRLSLEEIAGTEDATRVQRVEVLQILNKLGEDPEIYRNEIFEPIMAGVDNRSMWPGWVSRILASFETKKTTALEQIRDRADETKDIEQIQRLNRILISDSLPQWLAPAQIELTEIEVWESTKITTQALKVEESFMVWLKAALISGVVISSPWIFYQLWCFVAAGLYPHERRYIHLYLPISLFLFLSGILLAYFGVFKPVLMFLFAFNASMGIDPQPRIGEWLTFVMILPLGFGVAFQLPLVMLFLNRIGLFELSSYIDKWRMAVLVIFVASMVLTPADPISMLLLAAPLTVLYFGGILLCKWMPRSRNPFQEAYEP